jgi:hypothetical protein
VLNKVLTKNKSPFNLTHLDIYEKVIFRFKKYREEIFLFSQLLHTQVLTKPTYQAVKPHPNCRHQTFTI